MTKGRNARSIMSFLGTETKHTFWEYSDDWISTQTCQDLTKCWSEKQLSWSGSFDEYTIFKQLMLLEKPRIHYFACLDIYNGLFQKPRLFVPESMH